MGCSNLSLPGGDPTARPNRQIGRVRTSLYLAYENRTSAYRGSAPIDNKLGEDTTILTMTPTFSLALSGTWSAVLTASLVRLDYQILRHQDKSGQPLPRYSETETGVGDSSIMLQWSPEALKRDGMMSWFALGLSVPTAAERDYPPLSGTDFGEVLTIGTGTWDPILSHGFSFESGNVRWTHTLFFRLTPYENQFGYQAGSVFQSWSGGEYTFDASPLRTGIRVGYRHQWRARRDGLAVFNSGGDWVSIVPTFRWLITEKLSLLTSLEVTLWRDLYAAPSGSDQLVNGQTDADRRWSLGLSYEYGP
ncbi:MAG: hypothetical protein VYA30_09550 [Myxococcota bacterium]|nr:hypothetical protein [Myxococcota bacterium]